MCWGSRKQKSISLSSCESERIALSEAVKDVVYLRKFVRGLAPGSVTVLWKVGLRTMRGSRRVSDSRTR